MGTRIDRREELLRIAAGESTGYVPAGFFMHFDSTFHTGPAAVAKHREFFEFTGMDFVKIQLELPWPQAPIKTPKDWANLPVLGADFFAPSVEVVRGLVKELGARAPVILTLYSPFMVAAHMAPGGLLTEHLAEDPDAAGKGIEIAAEFMLAFVRSAMDAGLDGFYQSTQGAESARFKDPSIFEQKIKPYDLKVMNETASKCTFSILHVCDYHRREYGGYASPDPFVEYPGQIINSSLDFGGKPWTPKEISAKFRRPFMGGMDRKGALATGPEDAIRAEARSVIAEAGSPFILGADCTIPGTAPWTNLRAAIDEAHK